MNESTDDSNSSNISTSNGSRSHSELESNSQQGSSIGSAGSLVMRNRISNGMKNATMVKKFVVVDEECLNMDRYEK